MGLSETGLELGPALASIKCISTLGLTVPGSEDDPPPRPALELAAPTVGPAKLALESILY